LADKRKTAYAMSRARRNVVFALIALGAVVLIFVDRSPLSRRFRQHRPQSEEQVRAGDVGKYHGRNFTVVRVVDGDTLDIDIADGKYKTTRIRLLGIDTAETRNKKGASGYFGAEAAEFATKLALGKAVVVYLDEGGRTRGKYGRLLAYVKLPDERFLNEVLLTEGYAYADLRFRHGLYNKYKQLEAVARSQNKGLWENATRNQLPEWLQKKKPALLREK
jgi:endonuclease YncB( thermonuclease family)